ncbi:hypothetical protein BJ165DRAFT_1499482 [Panaeolus papilionaceus]|nr:hypothetical protein BJ165DRAFT_1499482 [Panaeolus papilionaceus]
MHKQPTPHEIFHLRHSASPAEIKARYFELVRIHHPDSMHVRRSRLSPHDAHHRFRNIKAAYDFLQGHTLSPHPNARPAPQPKNFDPYLHELARRRRSWDAARGAHRGSASFDEASAGSDMGRDFGGFDGFGAHPEERGTWNPDGRKERLILWAGVLTLAAGLFPSFPGTVLTMFYQPTAYVPISRSKSEPIASDCPTAATPSGSAPTLPFPAINFTPSLDKNHFAAAKALSQARSESREMGAERREGIRNRVKEIKGAPSGGAESLTTNVGLEVSLDQPDGSNSDPPSKRTAPPPNIPST